jgi:hypothetical protein
MRVTIIPVDGFVSVDGEECNGLDLSATPAGVHAVQWYDTEGEVEYVDARGRAIRNELITDLAPYQPALDAWRAARQAALEAEAARAEEEEEEEAGDSA